MSIVEFFQMIGMNVWVYGGTFLLVLGILVFVHEWGHYIAARLCGVKVEVFSIGFGKELFGFNDRAGTRWKICLVPLGGFVKMFGDVDPSSARFLDGVEEPEDGSVRPLTLHERKQAFFAKPIWQRALIVFAGPAINYIFAIILLTGLFIAVGQPVTPPVAAAVIGNSSAAKHGFLPHDLLISIDGKKIKDFDDIRQNMMISLDEERTFLIERDGKEMEIKARAEKIEVKDRFGFQHSMGVLGLISPRHAISLEKVKKIDGVEVSDFDSVRRELIKRLDTDFVIETEGSAQSNVLRVKPLKSFNKALMEQDESNPKSKILFIANVNPMENFVPNTPLEAAGKALAQAWTVTVGTIEALGQIIVGTRSPTELGGVIRIGALAGDMAQQGFIALILFTALLSINLGLINLFPIPVLDGGHLVFYAVESVLGRPIPDRIQEYAFQFGFTFLICVMVYANLSDIMQLIL